ncbi:MAG: hypothetical protein AAB421_00320 [Patescibacteria group bacterium]
MSPSEYVVVYGCRFGGGFPYIRFEPEVVSWKTYLENAGRWHQDGKHELIRNLKWALEELEKTSGVLDEDQDLGMLPPLKSVIYPIKDWGDGVYEIIPVIVDGYVIMNSRVCVLFGFYYKPVAEAYRTRAEAESALKKLREEKSPKAQ